MSYAVKFHPDALVELEECYEWYEERSEGLGNRFIAQVNKCIIEIAAHPERYARKKGNYREVMTAVFPYVIIYEVYKKEKTVFISYIFHTKRNPTQKFKR